MELYDIYNPITATPFACNETYVEAEPCAELKPYVKCFWGAPKPYRQAKTDIPIQGIVTPDTCADIIFSIDYTGNKVQGQFYGIDTQTFATYNSYEEEKVLSRFAIRFYPWSAVLFSEESMCDTQNACLDVGYHFSKLRRELEPLLFDAANMGERIRLAERYLLSHIHLERIKPILMEAIAGMLQSRGTMPIGRLSREIHISSRQLERLFRENVGVSPKQLSSLVRYQYLWQDALCKPDFRVLDAVYQYGYSDQAHLLHDFKRFHTMNIAEAQEYALQYV